LTVLSTELTSEITKRDPRLHAQAKADIRKEAEQKAKELTAEAEQIDGLILELEVKAAQEPDEARVLELLNERSRLESRKQALPFLLRGTQSRALHRQAAALKAEADDLKVDLDAAELEVTAASKRIPELQLQLDQANEVLAEATAMRDRLAHQHKSLASAASNTGANARCVERGEEPKF
jgi:hypothetical protein